MILPEVIVLKSARPVLTALLLLALLAAAGPVLARGNEQRAGVFFRFSLPYEQYLMMVDVPAGAGVAGAIEALIEGPPAGPFEPVLPANTRLLGVEIRNRVACVDLSREVTQVDTGSRGDGLIVAAIVNTAGAFLEVDRVQILIEGQIEEAAWGHVDTSRPLEPSLSLMFQPFPDIAWHPMSVSHWAVGPILAHCLEGAIAGYPDGLYRPSNPVTRAEFIKILAGAMRLSLARPAAPTFRDVPATHWAYEPIESALAAGVISVTDYDGAFSPSRPLTRREMAVMLTRAGGFEALAAERAGAVPPYTDTASEAGWSAGYIAAVTERGLMRGFPDSTFRPAGTTTRAETATVISRLAGTSRGGLCVISPRDGDRIDGGVLIAGSARVYEGTVQLRAVKDGETVAQTFTTATSGGPEWGVFAAVLDVPEGTGDCRIKVYWDDMESGAERDLISIPVFIP